MTAQELAKEISTAVLAKVALNYKTATIQQMNDMVASVIAAKIEPLVSDAERWKSECEAVRSLVIKYELRAEDADRYEQWLLDIGRAIGCQHLDEQLPNCVIQHLQGDQESEATNEH